LRARLEERGGAGALGAALAHGRHDGRLPIAPEPAQCRGQDRGPVVGVVAAVALDEADVVSGVIERAGQGLVGDPPVAAVDVEVASAVLEEYAQGARLRLADDRRIAVAAAQAGI